jgi:hypothetical protein
MNVGDVYIKLNDRPKIQLKPTPTSKGGGTPISNGTVVNIVDPPTIDNGNILVTVDGQTGYIQTKHLKVAQQIFNGKPIIGMEYRPHVAIEADAPLLAPPQQQYVPPQQPQQQYVPHPEPSPPSYDDVMANLPNFPVTYQDPVTLRWYKVGPNGESQWLNGGSHRRNYRRSCKKRLQKSRSKSRSNKRLRK